MTHSAAGPLLLYTASDDHRFHERSLTGYPLVVGSRGVFEPVQLYLRHKKARRGRKNGTLWDEAYILRRWIHYLDECELAWDAASNYTLEDFVARRAKLASQARVQREINVIWSFYWVAQEQLGLVSQLVECPERGEIGRHFPISANLTHKRTTTGKVLRRLGPAISVGVFPRGALRPTPNDDQVELVLSTLLGSSSKGRGAAWWLMANWMYRSTLRCMGVAGLTVSALSSALAAEGIKAGPRKLYDLPSLAKDLESQDRIKSNLSELAERGRTEVFVEVVEKRGKKRLAPVPIDVFETNLDFIWSDRAWLISLFERRNSFQGTDALFPSLKTGSHYQPNSISNLINAIFKKCDVPGSAHRLRAACCIHVMRTCYVRARALHGRAWDRESVLLEVAEIMGHSDPETLRPYLTRVEKEENLLQGEPLVVPLGSSAMLRGLADALEADDGELQGRLLQFMSREGIAELGLGRSLDDIRAAFRAKLSA